MEKPIYKVGDRVNCWGYEGTVVRVLTGQLQGMIEVRLPGGLTCTDVLDVDPIK